MYRFFAALMPLFERNMLEPRDFILPEEFLEGSVCFDRGFKLITANMYSKSSKLKLKSPDRTRCTCKILDNCKVSCANRAMGIECLATICPCGENCENQQIQKQLNAPVNLFQTKDKGYGIKAMNTIQKGCFIMEYIGEVITLQEYETRMETQYSNDKNFYCISLEKGYVIDSRNMGNICRFVNHSCMPNCAMQKWKINGIPRLALFAIKDIEPGEELTFDYDFMAFNSPQTCYCGTEACKNVIGNQIQKTNDQIFDSVESVTEPPIQSNRLLKYKIPKKNHNIAHELVNHSEYSRDAAGSFRVENLNKGSRSSKRLVYDQNYGKDSAGVYLMKDLKQKSRANQKFRTSKPYCVQDSSKTFHESGYVQSHRNQMPAEAGTACFEGFQMEQKHNSKGHSSVSLYNFRRVSSS